MINSKKELKNIIRNERKLYFEKPKNKIFLLDGFCKESPFIIWKYIKYLRITEFYFGKRKNVLCALKYLYYNRKKQKLGIKLGISIDHAEIGCGLMIYHYGSIVINGFSKIGCNCKLHGNNCIGNKGEGFNEAPTIGDNVDIGFGAVIIGNVHIANNVKIGAGTVVTKDIATAGSTVAGVPGRIIK